MTVDLSTRYLGLELRSPIVASASPLTRDPAAVAKIEEAGAGAIVMPSLFEEEIENEEIELAASLDQGTNHFAEALDYFPEVDTFIGEGDRYLRALESIKDRASVPVIASLNANSVGGWVRFAKLMADAGADALELNLYRISVDRARTAADIEAEDLDLIAAVRASVNLPLAVKLSPYYSSLANFAARVVEAGANGLVLFNRFYQPDIDLDELAVVPRVSLSHPSELRLPMRWTAILRPQLGPDVAIAATSGIHSGDDVVKALMVGADVAMIASAILREGPGKIAQIETEMRAWLEENEYSSVMQLRGSASQGSVEDPTTFERAQYIRTLHSWSAPAHRSATA
ncbi:MAG TPA: dihydroorotate dehydrogenase-like protein [Anaerolineae bacterium]|nr:dihydroorotate dehydrogenase-like protein [Anaerolineae bacterium]